MNITVNTLEEKEDLGDLFGIFFEDINHAADGGLYAELIQNRSFEFSPIDNTQYRALTGWEKVEIDGKTDWMVEDKEPVSKRNPHYLALDILQEGSRVGVRNLGFNSGIHLQEGHDYRFSCFARHPDEGAVSLCIMLTNGNGDELCKTVFEINKVWDSYEFILTPSESELCGRLEILVFGKGRTELDFISLFPTDTYRGRKNGLRKDLAEKLADMKPKFMRFPGGCLIHDGTLNPNDRDSMYRWKNTVGDITNRQSRRNNWNYNQTLGLGYYEYF